MRAAIYNRFWHSMGGGERHSGMIAEVLAADGVSVDLLGHSEVDLAELSARLGLDLERCTLRIEPDRGEAELERISAEYDLFVNATYMSRLRPRSGHAAYLCFFPTPFDHDLAAWRRTAIRTLGPRLPKSLYDLRLQFGVGWFPPEGGRSRRWIWSSGEGVVTVEPGPQRQLIADVARVGQAADTAVTITDEAGNELARWPVTARFTRFALPLPASETGHELRFHSDTFVPGGGDDRTLGVAVSRIRLSGDIGIGGRVAQRFPWLLRDPNDLSFLEHYDVVLANSTYTQGWIQRLWRSESAVLYPPIDVADLTPAAQREKIILTVGRFFAPGLGHAKRQLEMVRFFGDLTRDGALPGWSLHVVGGCEESQRPYLAKVAEAARGLPVTIHDNAPRSRVHELMTTASIFWSATGYTEDEERSPWSQEHFGMTTAEAMAGGCVPVVIDRAGQREIVRDGVDGYRWRTPAQLLERTRQVAADEQLRDKLATSAIERARQYSDAAFATRWRALAAEHSLLSAAHR